jgi:ectoine hydroxylase-related dioxygenase (phytanoyl-CoA dioxygenase family)
MTKVLNYELDIDSVVEHLDTRGMFVLRNLISKEQIEALKLEGQNLYRTSPKFSRNSRAGDSTGSYRINLVHARVVKFNGNDEVAEIKKIMDHPSIRLLANTALRSKSGVSNYLYDYSKVDSEHEKFELDLYPLHYDWRDHCRCIKFYIYLNDIDVEQGAIRYICYSQHLVRYLWATKSVEMEKLYESRTAEGGYSFNSLKSLLTAVSPDIEANYSDKETLKSLQTVVSDPEKSYEFAITGKKGDVLVFDENGIHGGGPLRFGNRNVCRIHFVDRNYVNRRLPEQQIGVVQRLTHLIRSLGRI